MAEYAKPRGTSDLTPDEAREWQEVEALLRSTFHVYHFREIRTPVFEHTEVYERGVGDTTDIVQKEMYTFTDRGGRSVTLRPEGTAGVARAFVEHKWYGGPLPLKLYYMGPIFRYEKPQAGRYRQHQQYGVEALGSEDPRLDVEIIELADRFLRAAGVRSLRLEINSVGCPVCRKEHRERLLAHLMPARDKLCTDCQGRLEKNPLRVLDCKIDRDQPIVAHSPTITDHLCADCAAHFAQVREGLDALCVPYVVNKVLVRGLDYYTKTAFEFMEDSIGAMSTILGGGRYDGLVRTLGGPDTPGVGFAGGMERLMLARRANQVPETGEDTVDAYVVGFGESGRMTAVRVARELRDAGIATEVDYTKRGLKAQMKTADRLRARVAVLCGDDEAAAGTAAVRDLVEKRQSGVMFRDVAGHVAQILANRRERGEENVGADA